ncbi:MAG: ribulose-phosphate 3-epimerase [Deltaproteobacteria bacterium]|nr:ribulose-phosphate 3-epimerase [Deltaproteobacteria bacterium]
MLVKVSPSLLSADFGRLAEETKAVEAAGADSVHVDVMDGRFVPNITIGPLVVKAIRKSTKLPLGVHLMIEEPEKYVPQFAEAGADTIYVHVEACVHLHRNLQQIRALNKRVGVALNPHTPVESIRWILRDVDAVLVMTVNPGFGGQAFIPQSVQKLKELRDEVDRQHLNVVIGVDGGIDAKTAPMVVGAGASELIAGAAVFGRPDYAEAIASIRKAGEAVRI